MVLALSLLLLAAVPDGGSPPPPQSSFGFVAIVWGGGKDTPAAYESLAKWDADKRLLGDRVTFAEGFPKIVSSATVTGLNPGFEIVVLGYCGRDEGKSERAYIKALYPSTYEKPVTGVKNTCPTWAGGQEHTLGTQRTAKGKELTLSVVELSTEPPDDSDLTSTPVPVRWLSVVARDSTGALLGVYQVTDDVAYVGGSNSVGCDTTVKSVRKDTAVLERGCIASSGACGRPPGERKRITVRWNGKAFIPEEKLLEEWSGMSCGE